MAKLLLLEDDPPTRLFLHEALLALPAQVQCTSTLAQAQAAISRASFDVWLFDANLPDGRSADLLSSLRRGGTLTPAIALTADVDALVSSMLRDAGFARVLIKPIGAGALRAAVTQMLAQQPEGHAATAIWNEEHALAAAGGVQTTRAALNALFLQELPTLQRQITDALEHGQHTLAAGLLHRLKGSCALVGAEALREAVFALANGLGQNALRDRFVSACERTLREKP